MYSLYHNLMLYCKPWQNWMKICIWVLFHGHFIKISLNIKCTSGFVLNRSLWNGFRCFIRLLGIKSSMSYSTLSPLGCSSLWHPLALSQSVHRWTDVLKENDTSKAGVVFFGCVLSEDKLWPAGYTFFFFRRNWLRPNAIAVSLHLSVMLTGNKQRLLVISHTCLWRLLY